MPLSLLSAATRWCGIPPRKTPLTALATQAVVERAMRRFGNAPDGLSAVVIGGRDIGQALVADTRVAVVSATGSTAMGRDVGPRLAARFARAILELGGNNAHCRAVGRSASGSPSHRFRGHGDGGPALCTTLRRLFVLCLHEGIGGGSSPPLWQSVAAEAATHVS